MASSAGEVRTGGTARVAIIGASLDPSITTFSGVCIYPFDTTRQRMMLSAEQPVKYRNALNDARVGQQVKYMNALHFVCGEGFRALFRGVTANMFLGMAGAGVLASYDQLQRVPFRHRYSFEPQQRVLK
ncbi:hypothetical protein CRG98_026162 [Punica granatum]|uniref:ADP/ATP translocase n=1 Tax=Punica granatum TaxID=22663 RepID=A0A2I0JB38_PUNGR|nr:hypothetical protein CRG98_026162 [Punica granatum]